MARPGSIEGLALTMAAGFYAALVYRRERKLQRTAVARPDLSDAEARVADLAPEVIRHEANPHANPGRVGEPHPRRVRFTETPDQAIARGRDAETPIGIPRRGWWDILKRTWQAMNRDHLGLVAAGVAFYALLAIFPAIGVAVAVAGLFTQPSDFVGALNSVSQLLPTAAADILLGQARQVAGSGGGGLTVAAVFGLLLALYSASRGVASLMEGLNVAYDETEKRGMVRLYLTSFVLTVVIIVGAILGLTATIIIPAVLGILGLHGSGLGGIISVLRWPILLVGTVCGLALIYRFGPSRAHARLSWLSPGALVACALWLVGTAGFAWYAGNFAHYNQTFGALGGVIVLLMWLWLSAFIVLIGAELNGEIEAQTARDSTTGPPQPMGRRGAVKADVLGEPTDQPDRGG